jgi:SAM-dependent methyltransferase
MAENPSSADWSTTRGERWLAHVAGMEAQFAPVDAPLIRAARLDGPLRIAEVGCGGGATAIELMRRAPEGSTVHGVDIAPGLIAHARARVRGAARAPRFDVADVATAAPEAPYERLVSRFGLMFFDDPQAAFTNLACWLAPRGWSAFAVWGPPADNPWFWSVREVVAGILALPPSPPDSPGPFRYAQAERMLAALERAGFAELAVQEWRGTIAIGGGLPAEPAARFALSAFSNFEELLAQSGAGAIDQARRTLAERFAREQRDGVVSFGARVHLIVGSRR